MAMTIKSDLDDINKTLEHVCKCLDVANKALEIALTKMEEVNKPRLKVIDGGNKDN